MVLDEQIFLEILSDVLGKVRKIESNREYKIYTLKDLLSHGVGRVNLS